jgi:hypothetical protein
MKKLVAVAALGVALAAIPVTAAMKGTGITVGSDQALAQGAPRGPFRSLPEAENQTERKINQAMPQRH